MKIIHKKMQKFNLKNKNVENKIKKMTGKHAILYN
jgi:hypothetical protein